MTPPFARWLSFTGPIRCCLEWWYDVGRCRAFYAHFFVSVRHALVPRAGAVRSFIATFENRTELHTTRHGIPTDAPGQEVKEKVPCAAVLYIVSFLPTAM